MRRVQHGNGGQCERGSRDEQRARVRGRRRRPGRRLRPGARHHAAGRRVDSPTGRQQEAGRQAVRHSGGPVLGGQRQRVLRRHRRDRVGRVRLGERGSGSGTCQHPVFTTSDQQGGWSTGGYYLTNDMWNAGNYSVTQTLYGCSAASWYVTATMNNNSGDGAVKTYPNVHKDFDAGPAISSFHSVSSTFAQVTNPAGIYEYAYDIWINGLATSNSTEVMIWTSNHGQVPSGSQVGTVTFGGQSFKAWKSGSYIAFVAGSNVNSGTVNLLQFFNWIIGKGWLTSSATLNQVDYGVELVSTNGAPETFTLSNFSVATS